MRNVLRLGLLTLCCLPLLAAIHLGVKALSLKPVASDPLVRQPGTQPAEGVVLESPRSCLICHSNYDAAHEPGSFWQGTMMAQSARDFLFWPSMVVAMQDSFHALETPNAADLCLRCHMPGAWLGGRSDPVNGSALADADFDGVQCDMCHRMVDPFHADTYAGVREGDDWPGYWDEQDPAAQTAADAAQLADRAVTDALALFNGAAAYGLDGRPAQAGYTENASGQYVVSPETEKRASFSDALEYHGVTYSRYHKSKYFCATCHDVSNVALANLALADTTPGDGTTILPSEAQNAHGFFPIERTYSEFMLSGFGQEGGAPGSGPFAPSRFKTSKPGNAIASCQDCHLPDAEAAGCFLGDPRPASSSAHPNSGMPVHDLTGGNLFVPYVLASTVEGSPVYDAANAALLNDRATELTLDPAQGLGLDPDALLAVVDRARTQLQHAADLARVQYDPATGALAFRIVNRTGHKLITGFPEGRRMFVNIQAYADGALRHEVNPYDATVGTLRGLEPDYSPSSPALTAQETHVDALVYEAHLSSLDRTGEAVTFHAALATGRYKDNRIPPRGFRIEEAAARMAEPVANGAAATDYFTPAEYAGGYDDVSLAIAPGADAVVLTLYYQTTSREYVEFLRDEINGTGRLTLPAEAYLAQTDALGGFFAGLATWGETVWQLWDHNKAVPGAAPVAMARAAYPQTDINGDRAVNALDIQFVINAALGLLADLYFPDANGDDLSNALDIQLTINAALGLARPGAVSL